MTDENAPAGTEADNVIDYSTWPDHKIPTVPVDLGYPEDEQKRRSFAYVDLTALAEFDLPNKFGAAALILMLMVRHETINGHDWEPFAITDARLRRFMPGIRYRPKHNAIKLLEDAGVIEIVARSHGNAPRARLTKAGRKLCR